MNQMNPNFLRQQVMHLPELVEDQIKGCFGPDLMDVMTMAEIFDARKIILTGCGDSYAAAVAMAPVIEKYCDCFGVTVMRAVEFTRFLSKEKIGIGEPNSPLVIAISVRGETARICEVLEKANAVGAFSILMTNAPESSAAKLAKRVYCLNIPDSPNAIPGLRSYFASLMGLIAFASRMGHVRGTLPPTGPESFRQAIRSYTSAVGAMLPMMDEKIRRLAETWKNFQKFDLIGDDVSYGSAFFGAAKLLECCGAAVTVDDSEDWCHINYFLADPKSIGTVVMADCHAPSFGRLRETVASAVAIGRPVLVISNAGAEAFAPGAEVCTLPDTPEGYPWLMPLMDFCPLALLAGWLAEYQQVPYFCQSFRSDGSPDSDNPFVTGACFTMSRSEIQIYD